MFHSPVDGAFLSQFLARTAPFKRVQVGEAKIHGKINLSKSLVCMYESYISIVAACLMYLSGPALALALSVYGSTDILSCMSLSRSSACVRIPIRRRLDFLFRFVFRISKGVVFGWNRSGMDARWAMRIASLSVLFEG